MTYYTYYNINIYIIFNLRKYMYKRMHTSTNIIDNFIREYKFNYIYILRVYIYEYTTYERHILVDPKRSTFFKEEKVFL